MLLSLAANLAHSCAEFVVLARKAPLIQTH
jgi:hypothetical protein